MNPFVQTPSEILAAIPKPRLQDINDLSLSPEDWLVVCAGFEDRALAILKQAVLTKTPFNVALVLYRPFVAENKEDDIRQICQANSINVVDLVYDRREPTGFGKTLIEALPGNCGRVFIDVSGMSRLLIVQVLVALKKRLRGFSGSFVAYAEARDYPPSEEEVKERLAKLESDPSCSIFFLSSGVFDITLVPELSSYAPAGVQTRLVAFPSLDDHQLTALRAELQPSRLSFIEGIPPAAHNEWRLNAIALVNRLELVQNSQMYRSSTLHYEQTLDRLLELYAAHSVHERVLISPTGSKMQAVAVGILRSFVEDVQIVYPTPRDFLKPEKYTDGVGPLHLLNLEAFSKNNGSS